MATTVMYKAPDSTRNLHHLLARKPSYKNCVPPETRTHHKLSCQLRGFLHNTEHDNKWYYEGVLSSTRVGN